jgi:hypothetical protein
MFTGFCVVYRVLCFLLLCGGPAAASLAHLPERAVVSPRPPADAPIEVLLYGFRATGEPAPHPMSDADGHWMWDALGQGCVDGGGWDDPFPEGKGDLRGAAFCIPQPCTRMLTRAELARDVLGRELEPGEYAVYLGRLARTCGTLPAAPTDLEADLGVEDLLHLASMAWVDLLEAENPVPTEESSGEAGALPAAVAAAPARAVATYAGQGMRFGATAPDTRRLPIFFQEPLGNGAASRRQSDRVSSAAFFGPLAGASRFFPRVLEARYGPEGPRVPPSTFPPGWGDDRPGGGPWPPGPREPSVTTPPAPVPLPPALLLLGGAIVALRLHGARRPRAREAGQGIA